MSTIPTTAPMWSEIFSRMLSLLTEESGGDAFQPSDMADWFYSGLLQSIAEAPIEVFYNTAIQDIYPINIQTDKVVYTLPATYFLRPKTVEFKKLSGGEFEYATYYDIDEFKAKTTRYRNDNSNRWTIWGKNLMIFPKPTADLASGLNLYYLKPPAEYDGTDTTRIDIPKAIVAPAIYYGCSLAKVKDYEDNRGTNFFRLYEYHMQRLAQVYQISPPKTGITPEQEATMKK